MHRHWRHRKFTPRSFAGCVSALVRTAAGCNTTERENLRFQLFSEALLCKGVQNQRTATDPADPADPAGIPPLLVPRSSAPLCPLSLLHVGVCLLCHVRKETEGRGGEVLGRDCCCETKSIEHTRRLRPLSSLCGIKAATCRGYNRGEGGEDSGTIVCAH